MKTNELIAEVWDRVPSVKRKEVVSILEAYGDLVKQQVLAGDKVALPTVGKFYLVTRATRKYYNKHTGTIETYTGGAKVIRFRMSPKVVK